MVAEFNASIAYPCLREYFQGRYGCAKHGVCSDPAELLGVERNA